MQVWKYLQVWIWQLQLDCQTTKLNFPPNISAIQCSRSHVDNSEILLLTQHAPCMAIVHMQMYETDTWLNSHKWNKISLYGMLGSCRDISNITVITPSDYIMLDLNFIHTLVLVAIWVSQKRNANVGDRRDGVHGVVDRVQCFTRTVCGSFWDGQHYYVSYMMYWHITIASSKQLRVPSKRCMYTYQVPQSVSGLRYTWIVHAGCKMNLTIKCMHTICPEVTPIPQFLGN